MASYRYRSHFRDTGEHICCDDFQTLYRSTLRRIKAFPYVGCNPVIYDDREGREVCAFFTFRAGDGAVVWLYDVRTALNEVIWTASPEFVRNYFLSDAKEC